MPEPAAPVRPKILVVDDEPVTRELFRTLLQAVDAEVIEACDGYEALSAVRRHFFSLVLLDINMPGLNGHQVAAALRRDPHSSALPIVFVTGTAPEDGAQAAEMLGKADLLLAKPVDPDTLRALARLLLRLYTARDQALQEVQYLRTEMREPCPRIAVPAPVDRS